MMGIIGPLLASFAATDVAAFTHKLKRNAMLFGFALVFLLTAYILAVTALAVYLGQMWGLPVALLVVAGGALVLALIMFAWVSIANRADERRKREAAAANSSKALMVTAALTALPMVMKSRTLLLAAGAAGLGFLLMRNSGSAGRYTDPAE